MEDLENLGSASSTHAKVGRRGTKSRRGSMWWHFNMVACAYHLGYPEVPVGLSVGIWKGRLDWWTSRSLGEVQRGGNAVTRSQWSEPQTTVVAPVTLQRSPVQNQTGPAALKQKPTRSMLMPHRQEVPSSTATLALPTCPESTPGQQEREELSIYQWDIKLSTIWGRGSGEELWGLGKLTTSSGKCLAFMIT